MVDIAGFTPTGRQLLGPGSDLVELSDSSGYRHTAVVFHPELRDHPALRGMDVIFGFLEASYVSGLLDLVTHDRDQGAFVYATGQAWCVQEVVRILADSGEVAGVRAGLELLYSAGSILIEAHDAGSQQGVYAHAGISPWRVLLKQQGQVEVLGYALPQVDILQFQADGRVIPPEDSFRYCPPERLEGRPESLSSDLFGLALVAFELMTGKPVYDGLVNEIRTQASRAEGSRRLFKFKDDLPREARDLLATCLRGSAEDRFPDGDAFLRAVRGALAEAPGEPLVDVMTRVSRKRVRRGRGLDDGKTQQLGPEEIARIQAHDEVEEQRQRARDSWSRPSASRRPRREEPAPRREAAPPPAPTPAPPPRESGGIPESVRRSMDGPRRPRRSRDDRFEAPRRSRPPRREPEPPTPVEPVRAEPVRAEPVEPVRPEPVQTPRRRPRRVEPRPQPSEASSPPTRPARSSSARSGDGRWGKPARRRRGETTAPQPLQEELSAPVRSEEPGTDYEHTDSIALELVEQLTDSGGGQSRSRAVDVIESILQGSSSGDRKRTTRSLDDPWSSPPPPPPEPIAEPAIHRGPPPEDDPTLDQGQGNGGFGSWGGGFGPFGAPPSQPESESQPFHPGTPFQDARDPFEEQAQEDAPAQASSPFGDRGGPSHSQAFRDEPAPRSDPAPRSEPAPPKEPEPAQEAPQAPGFLPPSRPEARVPDLIPPVPGGRSLTFAICRGPGAKPMRAKLPGDYTAAQAVSHLVGRLLPVRLDLQGRLQFGYRLGTQDGPVPGDTPLSSLEGQTLVLHPAPARELWVDFEVRSSGAPTRFRAPLNTALTVASVCDALAGWLSLPEGRWQLRVGDRILPAQLLLEEVELRGQTLVLSR